MTAPITVKLELDLSLRRGVTLAQISGSVEARIIAEFATRGVVRSKLIEAPKQSGLKGTVLIDGERVPI